MGKLLDFVREWYDIRREKEGYCKSCEILKEQLSTANFEKKQLLERVLQPTTVTTPNTIVTPEPITPKIVPWHIQRQMLEAEDRAKAQTIRRQKEDEAKANASKKQSQEISVEELERELGVE